jgi:ribonuclease Z
VDFDACFTGFSKALYSNWLFYRPDHLLIDCGEGCATTLGNGNYAIERIFLTHGHIDHTGGLASFIWARAAGMGDNAKPLEILHPQDDPYIAQLRTWLDAVTHSLSYDLTWTPLETGQCVPLLTEGRHTRHIASFATDHMHSLTLGYKLVEKRRRLQAAYAHLPQEEIAQRAREAGREAVDEMMEEFDTTLVAWGGDGLALPLEPIREAQVLFHEATLLDAADRKSQKHSTLEEAICTARDAHVQTLVVNHVSGRYMREEVTEAARETAARIGFRGALWLLWRHRWIEVNQ